MIYSYQLADSLVRERRGEARPHRRRGGPRGLPWPWRDWDDLGRHHRSKAVQGRLRSRNLITAASRSSSATVALARSWSARAKALGCSASILHSDGSLTEKSPHPRRLSASRPFISQKTLDEDADDPEDGRTRRLPSRGHQAVAGQRARRLREVERAPRSDRLVPLPTKRTRASTRPCEKRSACLKRRSRPTSSATANTSAATIPVLSHGRDVARRPFGAGAARVLPGPRRGLALGRRDRSIVSRVSSSATSATKAEVSRWRTARCGRWASVALRRAPRDAHALTAGFRDEFYYVACGVEHLALGYMSITLRSSRCGWRCRARAVRRRLARALASLRRLSSAAGRSSSPASSRAARGALGLRCRALRGRARSSRPLHLSIDGFLLDERVRRLLLGARGAPLVVAITGTAAPSQSGHGLGVVLGLGLENKLSTWGSSGRGSSVWESCCRPRARSSVHEVGRHGSPWGLPSRCGPRTSCGRQSTGFMSPRSS